MSQRVLSGMRPTGRLHLGNYFGAIVQFLNLQKAGHECFYFVADLHALTEVSGPTEIDALSVEAVKNYLACGVDPDRSTLYRQSDVPEVSEITVLLGNIASLARMRLCTTYKGKRDALVIKAMGEKDVDEEQAHLLIEEDREAEVLDYLSLRQYDNKFSYGLLGYPVLMAADILAVRSTLVPVGADQEQHVEMSRAIAKTFNHMFQTEVFPIPKITAQSTLTVRGIDGAEKMGKSDGNTIALLEDVPSARKKVMGIPTQAEPGGEMTPGTQALYNLAELICPGDVHTDFLRRYTNREGKFFGEMKERLAGDVVALLEPIQQRYAELSDDDVRDILANGAQKVRPIAAAVLGDMQTAMGLRKKE